jgi:hypothetical protein
VSEEQSCHWKDHDVGKRGFGIYGARNVLFRLHSGQNGTVTIRNLKLISHWTLFLQQIGSISKE